MAPVYQKFLDPPLPLNHLTQTFLDVQFVESSLATPSELIRLNLLVTLGEAPLIDSSVKVANEARSKCLIDVSGDIGHADESGHLFIVDRLKELIKYKGFQVRC